MYKDKLNVLVVEDEEPLRNLLVQGLSSYGYRVESAGNAANGWEKVQTGIMNEPWDILVTDLYLSDRDGVWLLKQSRDLNPDLVVLIITGFGTVESAVEALHLGASDYIQKPFKLETLKLKMDRAWENRILNRENRQLKRELALYQIYELFMGDPDPGKLLEASLQSLGQMIGRSGVMIKLEDGTQLANPEWREGTEPPALKVTLESKGRRYGDIQVKAPGGELNSDQRTGLALLAKNLSLALENLELIRGSKPNLGEPDVPLSLVIDSYKYAVLGEISSSLVHEMRNPLSAITLGVEYFGMFMEGGEKTSKALGSINKSVERLNSILNNLSLYSKDTSGMASTSLLSDIVRKAMGLVSYYLSAKKIQVDLAGTDNERPVVVNPGQLQQALVDVLVFQAKKMAAGGDLRISISSRDDEMSIQIENPSLFMEQQQLRSALEPTILYWETGGDLSLCLARRLLMKNKGRLEAHSDKNGGTRFLLFLGRGN